MSIIDDLDNEKFKKDDGLDVTMGKGNHTKEDVLQQEKINKGPENTQEKKEPWVTLTDKFDDPKYNQDIWHTPSVSSDERDTRQRGYDIQVNNPERFGERLQKKLEQTGEALSNLVNDLSLRVGKFGATVYTQLENAIYETTERAYDRNERTNTDRREKTPENEVDIITENLKEEEKKTIYAEMNHPEIYTESKYFGDISDAVEMEIVISEALFQSHKLDEISPETYFTLRNFYGGCCSDYGALEGRAYFAEKLYEFGRTGKPPADLVETKFLKVSEKDLKTLGEMLKGMYFSDAIVEKMNAVGKELEEKHKENFDIIEKNWNSRSGVDAYAADRLGYQIWENILESKDRVIVIGEGKDKVKQPCNISQNFDDLVRLRKLYGNTGQAEFGRDVFEFVLSNGKVVPEKWQQHHLKSDTMLKNLYNSFSEINFSGFYEKTKDGVIDSTEKRSKNIQEEINNLRKEVDPKFKQEQERQKEEERINGINKRLEELTRILNNQNELIMNVKKLFNGGRERGPETKNFEENLEDLEKIENDLEKIKRKIKNKGTNEEEKELLKKERGKLQKRQKEIEAMLEAKEIEDLKNWRTKADHWSNFINYTVNGEDKGIYLDNNRILSQRGNADGERASVTEGFLIRTVAEMQNIGTQGMSIDDKKEWGTIQQELDELLGSEVTSSEIVLNNLEQLPDLVNKIREKVGNGESATVSEELEKVQNCITEIRENNGTEPIEIADVVAKENNMRIDLENWLGNRSGTIQYVVNGKKIGLDEEQERERLNETEDLKILEGTTLDDILVISTIDSMNLTSFAGSGAPTADLPNGKGTFEQEWMAAKETLEGLLDENLSLSWREQKSLKEVQKLAGEIQAKLRNNNPDIETEIQNLSSKINAIENNHHK